jgi:hypothetical protein
MRRSTLLTGSIVACLSAGGALYVLWRGAPAPAASASATVQSDVDQLRQQVAQLERAVRRSGRYHPGGRPWDENAPPTADTDEVAAEQEERAAPPEEPTREEVEAAVAARYEFFESSLMAERRDSGWAQATERDVHEAFQSEGRPEQIQLQRVQCASTMCRIEATGRSRDDLDAFAEYMVDNVRSVPRGTVRVLSNGTTWCSVSWFRVRCGFVPPEEGSCRQRRVARCGQDSL